MKARVGVFGECAPLSSRKLPDFSSPSSSPQLEKC